ncbi:fluoride efflux transporter FluC [Streptomyces daghestanicus]|uniref:Fluoride-specific ion channel FluC n=1 Tax=Streptomyces daghestanicus TaxID=66885 RepID=A0ABQ3QCU4_9ACTN|nr:CrcB family protein [Streptomyces daghestanicus]GGU14680.1 putative fluoride ion transporter CrcB 2 [Streptomyces daghestanicus]GHI35088.1 putative fluoride ion transporter CrcB 2 [Streptomyces daghestanicus]
MNTVLLVLAGGACGAVARYSIGLAAGPHQSRPFHWGTFLANMAACLVLGFLTEAGGDDALGAPGQALLATGFCGALSTWSTFSHEVLATAGGRRTAAAAGYLLVTVAAGLALSFAGSAVAAALW